MSNGKPYFLIVILGNDPKAVPTDSFRGWVRWVFKETSDALDYFDLICCVPDFSGIFVMPILLK